MIVSDQWSYNFVFKKIDVPRTETSIFFLPVFPDFQHSVYAFSTAVTAKMVGLCIPIRSMSASILFLSSSFGMIPSQNLSSVEHTSSETFSDTIDDLILSSLAETKEAVYKDPEISSSNRYKEIIFRLYQQGIFQLKDAVIKVAEQLNISKNTVYLHIRNFKNNSTAE